MIHARGLPFVRDAIVATALLAVLYGLAQYGRFQPLQIPGYLLIVGFDALEMIFVPAGDGYPAVFAAYLVALGFLGAAVSHLVRGRTSGDHPVGWRLGVAGAVGVIGALSLLLAVAILFGTSQVGPGLLTGAIGLGLLGLAAWLAGLIDVSVRR